MPSLTSPCSSQSMSAELLPRATCGAPFPPFILPRGFDAIMLPDAAHHLVYLAVARRFWAIFRPERPLGCSRRADRCPGRILPQLAAAVTPAKLPASRKRRQRCSDLVDQMGRVPAALDIRSLIPVSIRRWTLLQPARAVPLATCNGLRLAMRCRSKPVAEAGRW